MVFGKVITLLFLLSFCITRANGAECTDNEKRINEVNSRILYDLNNVTKTPKTIEMSTVSEDGYIQEKGNVSFSRCGELMSGLMFQEKKSIAPKGTLTTTFKYSLSKQDDGWSYRYDFKMVDTDRATQQQKQLSEQHTDGIFLLNKYGVISRSSDRSEMTTGTVKNAGIADTAFTLDNNNQLKDVTRTSNIRSDNSKTNYEYDDKGRLKIKRSATEVAEYTYDELGREKSLFSTKTYFTIDKTLTTCKSWNSNGQCTLAEQQTKIIIPGIGESKDKIEEHIATLKYDYVYWD